MDRGPRHAVPTWTLGSRANNNPTARAALFDPSFLRGQIFIKGFFVFSFLKNLAQSFNPYDTKTVLRQKMGAERKRAQAERADAPLHAARIFMEHIAPGPDDCVALYYPYRSELDTFPLRDELQTRAISVALPVVTEEDAPLIFRSWTPQTNLVSGKFKIQVPDENSATITPTIIVCPLLAFGSKGERLGYGGGFYDRTLEKLRAMGGVRAIGYGYGAQRLDHLPTNRLDQPLDWMITERGALNFEPR